MLILKLILSGIVLIIIPLILGLLLTKFMKEKNNIILAFLLGYLVEFASFELIYVPMYFLNFSFKLVEIVWTSVILIMVIVSIIINAKRFKEIALDNLKNIKSMPKAIIIFLILLCIQVYVPVRYMQRVDPDDAFYLATVNTTIETNTMFKYDAYTGAKYTSNMLRYSMAGLSIWFAVISELIHVHPAILQHTIWPSIAIPLEIMIYALIAKKIFKEDNKKVVHFLILLCITYIFGFISPHANFSFFAYRSWQGKALIGNFIIPLVLLLYINCMENKEYIINWIVFILAMIASCFVTSMGVFLVPIEVGILSIISFFQTKKFTTSIKIVSCCIPQIIVGIVYLIFS